MSNNADTYRVFFALWPPAVLVTQIEQAMAAALKSCNGRKIRTENLHITLAFIGSVNLERLHCLQEVAASLKGECFDLLLDELGYWSRPRIVWLGASDMPAALMHLQADLVEALARDCGYQPETRPFQAHLSLMRKARHGPIEREFAPITWRVDRVSLIRSLTYPQGVEYEVLNHWPLTG